MGLPVPVTSVGVEGLRVFLDRPERALIGLDFDGTLSPIVADPAQARPAPGALVAVSRLARHVDTLAIVTGRPARTAVELLALSDLDGANLAVLGHYGLERWTPDGGVVREAEVDGGAIEAVRVAVPKLLGKLAAPAGTAIEDKGEAVAVHVRRTEDPATAMALLREPLAQLARSHGLRLEPGRMVLELRPPGIDKGRALESLADARGVRAVCYAGDDLGDLAAFDAVTRLRRKGLAGIAVCSGSDDVPELRARADLVLEGPPALVDFLNALSDAVESRH